MFYPILALYLKTLLQAFYNPMIDVFVVKFANSEEYVGLNPQDQEIINTISQAQ